MNNKMKINDRIKFKKNVLFNETEKNFEFNSLNLFY